MTTNVYAAKRAVFDRLVQLAEPGGPLDGVQVAYSWPGALAQLECVYGGGVTFDQPGDRDLEDGTRRVVYETAQVSVHIRVALSPPPVDGIRDSDVRAEEIGVAIGAALAENRQLAGGKSVTRVTGGQGDYNPPDDQAAVSTLSYRISVESHFEQ